MAAPSNIKAARKWVRVPREISADNLTVTVKDAMSLTGLGKTRLYQLIANGTLDARKDGSRTLITGASLRAYAAGLPKWSPGPIDPAQ